MAELPLNSSHCCLGPVADSCSLKSGQIRFAIETFFVRLSAAMRCQGEARGDIGVNLLTWRAKKLQLVLTVERRHRASFRAAKVIGKVKMVNCLHFYE